MILNRLMEILAPISCLGCGVEGAVLCTTCQLELVDSRANCCYACGRATATGDTCVACLEKTSLSGVSVGAVYGGPVKELILQLKFHRLRAAALAAADLVMAGARDWPSIDLVTSVPVAASRYRERGYNQSELLGREVARRAGLPYRPVLGRLGTTHQIGLDRRSRFEHISGAFFATGRLEGQSVLITDDVVTTGATLAECAAVLKAAGASQVWAAAIARH